MSSPGIELGSKGEFSTTGLTRVIGKRLIEAGYGGKNRSLRKNPGRFCPASYINDTKTDRAEVC